MSRSRTRMSVLSLVVFVGLVATPGKDAGAATIVFQEDLNGYTGTVDTYIKGGVPTSSYGSSSVVEWDGDDLGGQDFGLLRFENLFGGGPNQIPSGAVILSATLTYNVTNAGHTGSANEVVVDWDESVTYNTFGGDAGVQPDEYGALVGSAAGGSGDQTLDVTTSMADWADNPSANKGWIFRPTGGTDGVAFRSSENSTTSSRPELTVNYILVTKVEILPDYIDAVVGSAHVQVTLFIPPGSNDESAVEVTLGTSDADVAVPVGASGEPPELVLTFDIGAPTQQDVDIDIGNVGSAAITTTNNAGLGDETLTVDVTAGEVTFTPEAVYAIENTGMPVTVAISAGSNDTRSVVVTLFTDDETVAVPAGASGDPPALNLTFAEGASTQQVVDLEIGVSGDASITTTNDGGLDDAALPVHVTTGFNFTVSADMRDKITLWDALLAAINTYIGGPGVFHISPGDIDPPQPVRDKIDARFGPSAIWYPGIGNHEEETSSDMDWLRAEYNNGNNSGRTPLRDLTNDDGPPSTVETTYSWDQGNARFIMLNEYWDGSSDVGTDGDVIPELRAWLADKLDANTRPVAFVFGHEPAYPFNRHTDNSLNKYEANRDAFWQLLEDECVMAYFCGHTHVYKRYQQNPPDGTWQVDVGNAGNVSNGYPDGQTFANVTVTADAVVRYDIWRNVTGSWQLEDTWTVPIPLKIGLNKTVLEHTIQLGENLLNDTFTVTAVGPGTLNYTIDDDAAWLSVDPPSGGVSAGDEDTINVIYEVAGLPTGVHTATISVSSGDACKSPETIAVTITIEGPSIVVSPEEINRTVFLGDDLPDDEDAFTVANGGAGTLNYTLDVDDDADWLSVDPTSGDSTGEPDPIDLSYTVAGLPVGLHTGVITVSSIDPGVPPKTVTVNVTVETVSPDFDGDGDVDQEDFGYLQRCFSGNGIAYAAGCEDADLDQGNDVDGTDFGILQGCLSGPNVPAERTCDD